MLPLTPVLFCLGLVLGRAPHHPIKTLGALLAFGVRHLIAIAAPTTTVLKRVAVALGRVWRVIDGPATRARVLVVGLIVLANTLASHSALAGWATLFVFGASRSLLTSAFRGCPAALTRLPPPSAPAAGLAPFDETAFAATLAPHSDQELRRRARQLTDELHHNPALTGEDRHVHEQQRRVIYATLDARRAARSGSPCHP